MPIELSDLARAVRRGDLIPYLGAGALTGVVDVETGEPIPADSTSLILGLNGGKPMAPKLMYEFPRAAMNVELKRGRGAVTRFLDTTYGTRQWTPSPLHQWLAGAGLPYIIDTNRDLQLQALYADRPHTLIRGVARIGGSDWRFRMHAFADGCYQEIEPEQMDPALPILFKPLGSPRPDATYIASDADFVDYLTELMGGFGIPPQVKDYRRERQYLYLGLPLTRDTERMLLSDICYGAGAPTGWALLPEPTDKELRFCASKGIEVIEADWPALLAVAASAAAEDPIPQVHEIGC